MGKKQRKPLMTEIPVAPGTRFIGLTSLAVVRAEQARLYRMLYSQTRRLSNDDWKRAKSILIDIRDTLLAQAGKAIPGQSFVTNNTLVVSGGLQRSDELLARFARPGSAIGDARVVPERLVLSPEVHPGEVGHGAPVAVSEDQGGGGEP